VGEEEEEEEKEEERRRRKGGWGGREEIACHFPKKSCTLRSSLGFSFVYFLVLHYLLP
jgi:hypothetical protein